MLTEIAMSKNWNKLFASSPLLFDGGIGTELYERGFYINRPFEELNLSHPKEVTAVHESYLKAGAQVLTTNTFSIPSPQLKKFDIEHQQEKLLLAGIKCAHQAVQSWINHENHSSMSASNASWPKIALSFGPMGVLVEPLGPTSLEQVFTEYQTLARYAQNAKSQGSSFDLYILETFTHLEELNQAILGIRSVDSHRPIIASFTSRSSETNLIQKMVEMLNAHSGVDAIGMNCSEGPQDLFYSLKQISSLTSKPILIQPNAGIPRNINGRYFYMTSPDYMAKYAKRYLELGAFAVGGCCGTGPDHIRAMALALQAEMAKSETQKNTPNHEQKNADFIDEPSELHIDWTQRKVSKVGEKIQAHQKVITVEVVSPKGTDLRKFTQGIEKLAQAGVQFVNIPDGARAATRVSSLHLASYLQKLNLGITAIPHLTTRDRNLIALQSDLLGASINGVHDLLLITGDPPKLGASQDTTAVYDIDSIGLTYLANALNAGRSPQGDSLGSGTQFGIGVAANPTAINLELELKRWKYKVESGADFAVTQPIFEPETLRKWLHQIQPQHKRPHIVGIWPFLSYKNAEFMAHEVPGVFVPDWALKEMEKASTNTQTSYKKGIEIALRTIQTLWDEVEGFAISAPLGKIEIVLELLKELPKK